MLPNSRKATPAPKVPKDKYAKVTPKIPKSVLISIISVFVVIIAIIILTTPSNEGAIYTSYKDNANADFTENHPFYQVNYNDRLFRRGLETIIEEEEVVIIFIGFATCPACQQHIGAFERYFYSEGMDQYTDTFYYHNIVADQTGFEAFGLAHAQVSGSVPQLLVFKNGVFVNAFSPSTTGQTINASVRDFFRAVKTQLDA
ncbi:MAG: hypothetical protein ACNA7K_01895 [Acholeplasmataceae bacterium]